MENMLWKLLRTNFQMFQKVSVFLLTGLVRS